MSHFFVIEFVPSAVPSQTNYLEQKGILSRLRCLFYLVHFNVFELSISGLSYDEMKMRPSKGLPPAMSSCVPS